MAKGYESHITLYENNGWFGDGTSNPLVPIIESESLTQGRMTKERTSMARSTRAQLEDSLVTGDGSGNTEYKPEGEIKITPRMEDIASVLMSHFQVVDYFPTGSSFLSTFIPSKLTPSFSGNNVYGDGAWGAEVNDVYSIDVKKRLINTQGSANLQHYKRGICSKLSFNNTANDDFSIGAEFKFKDVSIDSSTSEFGDADMGDYTTGSITDWSHGTWSFNSVSGDSIMDDIIEISSIEINCDNNITEKKTLGNNQRQTFNFGNYTVKGKFNTEYLYDGWFEDEQDPFSIVGTMFHSDTEYLVIELPRCIIKPFNRELPSPDDFIEAEVEFEAYEHNGTSPITVTLHTPESTPSFELELYNAGMGARTLSEFDFANAGFGARTLSEYDFADRDL